MISKLQYITIILLLGMAITLSVKIWLLNKIPESPTFNLHIKSIRSGIEMMNSMCHKHYSHIKQNFNSSQKPTIVHAIGIMDSIMSFEDSAKFYFHSIASSKENSDSVQYYFSRYSLFSKRYSNFLKITVNLDEENYLLNISKKLPGKQLPFNSPHGVEILTLLLEAEFYESTQHALYKITN